jgi:hypothetical protein
MVVPGAACAGTPQKKGRAQSSAEVQQGGMKMMRKAALHRSYAEYAIIP